MGVEGMVGGVSTGVPDSITTAASLMLDKDWNAGDWFRSTRWRVVTLKHQRDMRAAETRDNSNNLDGIEGANERSMQENVKQQFSCLSEQIKQHATFLYPLLQEQSPLTLVEGLVPPSDLARDCQQLSLQMILNKEEKVSPVAYRLLLSDGEGEKSKVIGESHTLNDLADMMTERLAEHAGEFPTRIDFFDQAHGILAKNARHTEYTQQDVPEGTLTTLRTPGAVFYHELPAAALNRQTVGDGPDVWDLSQVKPFDAVCQLDAPQSCVPLIFCSMSSKRAELSALNRFLPFLRQQADVYEVRGLTWPTRSDCANRPNSALATFRRNLQHLARAAIEQELPDVTAGKLRVSLHVKAEQETVAVGDAITQHKQAVTSTIEFRNPGADTIVRARPLIDWCQVLCSGDLLETRLDVAHKKLS